MIKDVRLYFRCSINFHCILSLGLLASRIDILNYISHHIKMKLHERFSYGLGIALKIAGVARMELNYCVPVKVEMLLVFFCYVNN